MNIIKISINNLEANIVIKTKIHNNLEINITQLKLQRK